MKKDNVISVLKDENNDNITLSINDSQYFAVEFMTEQIMDQKELIKYIKNIERVIRSSPEYRNLMKYFKQELNFNNCIYLNNVQDVSVEMHHSPYTLFDLVVIVIKKFEDEGIPYNTFTVANHVVLLHYKNMVGLVPLSKTMHELVHADNSFHIHKDLHIGLVKEFYDEYKQYMSPELQAVYINWVNYSKEYEDDKYNGLNLYSSAKREILINDIKDVNNWDNNELEYKDEEEEYPSIEGMQSV